MNALNKFAIVFTLSIPTAAYAQREVPPTDFVQPSPNDVVLGGNDMSKTVTCEGNAVYIEGEHNEVQVNGNCLFVRIQGNRNYVWIDRNTTANVEGNDNTVFVSNPETKYSSRGNGNRFERAKH